MKRQAPTFRRPITEPTGFSVASPSANLQAGECIAPLEAAEFRSPRTGGVFTNGLFEKCQKEVGMMFQVVNQWFLRVVAVSLVLVFMAVPAQAHPDTVSGEASGATVNAGGAVLGPTPQAVLPSDGGYATAESSSLSVPNVLSTETLSAITGGGIGDLDTSAQSLTTVENVNLLNGLIRADLLVPMASSTGDGAAATSDATGSEVVNLVVNGVSLGNVRAPNVRIPIPGGTLIVNEHVVSGDGVSTSSITVNSLHVILQDALTGATTGEIKVGSASSGVVTSPFIPAHVQLPQCQFMTGGGRIDREPPQSNQDFATFGFNATMRNTVPNCPGPAGQLQYVDHHIKFKFHGTSADIVAVFTDSEFGGDCKTIVGSGRFNLNNTGWVASDYRADACDNGEPGVGRDKFRIIVFNAGYDSLAEGKGPKLTGGNIQAHFK